MNQLKDKVALITGGNSGIGLATARLFKEQGAKVIITARSQKTYEVAQAEYGKQFDVVQTDVSQLSELDRLYKHVENKYKKIDIVMANAGVAHFLPTPSVDEDFYNNQFNTNVKGLYFTVAKALPFLNPNSSVILTASVVSIKGFAGGSVYAATKAAVRSFARSWTAEIHPDQARFNVLSPGPIETPIYSKMGLPSDHAAAFAEQMKSLVPAKRFGTSEEMASLALFLASDQSRYICGADIMADGGFGQI